MDKTEPAEYVSLHLLCQGIEIMLKGLLLHSDYNAFKPKLIKFGHNLPKVVDACLKAYGLKSLKSDIRAELHSIDKFYRMHRLRYASAIDIVINPHSISKTKLLRRTCSSIRLADRELKRRTN